MHIIYPKNHWHLVLRYPYLWVRGRYLEPLREGSGPSGNIGRGTEVPKTDKNWLTINLFIRVQNMLNMINGHARHKLHKFDIFCAFSSCYVFCSAARNHQCITEIVRRDFWRDMFNRYNIYIYNKYYQMLSSTCCLGLIIHIYIYNLDKQAGSSAKILCGIPLWIVCPSSFFCWSKTKTAIKQVAQSNARI